MRLLTVLVICFAVIVWGISGCGNDGENKEVSTSYDRSEPYVPPDEYIPTDLQAPAEPYTPAEEYTPTDLQAPAEPYAPVEEYTPTEL